MNEALTIIDYLGTVVFAITGASIAAKIEFDFVGMLFLAFLTAVGGGTVRDIIITGDVFWTREPIYLYLIFAATVSTFFLNRFYEKYESILLFLDTLGLGAFVIFGCSKTMALGFNTETTFIMGVISAVLGGVLRSAFSKELSILANRELYASVAAAAAIIFISLSSFQLNLGLICFIVISSTFIIRYMARRYGIKVPTLTSHDDK